MPPHVLSSSATNACYINDVAVYSGTGTIRAVLLKSLLRMCPLASSKWRFNLLKRVTRQATPKNPSSVASCRPLLERRVQKRLSSLKIYPSAIFRDCPLSLKCVTVGLGRGGRSARRPLCTAVSGTSSKEQDGVGNVGLLDVLRDSGIGGILRSLWLLLGYRSNALWRGKEVVRCAA